MGNLFGDIFFDIVVMLIGSIGMLFFVSLGSDGFGLFEFVYGFVLDIVGQDKVNFLVQVFSVVMMLCYGLD